jgi:hypothetical protein
MAEGLPARPEPRGALLILLIVSSGSGGEDGRGGAMTGPYSRSTTSQKRGSFHGALPLTQWPYSPLPRIEGKRKSPLLSPKRAIDRLGRADKIKLISVEKQEDLCLH